MNILEGVERTMIEVDQKIKVRYRISPFSKNYYVDQEEKKKIPVPEIYAGINDLFAGLSYHVYTDQ